MADMWRVRSLRLDEVELALDWAAAEGWNPGLADARAFHAADPEGFLVGEVAGEPVATISAVRYGSDFGFIGFYIVKPGRRGQGWGWRLWRTAMEGLAGRNVALDGVVAQQDNYRKSGFRLAWRNIRQVGVTGGLPGKLPVVSLSELPFADVCACDRLNFPEAREAFLREWIIQPRALALGIPGRQALAAMGVVRPCRSGWKVGPLYADSPELARDLLRTLIASLPPGEAFYLDTPETNPHALALAREEGMTPCFETARMYTGPVPQLDPGRFYGVTSFELG